MLIKFNIEDTAVSQNIVIFLVLDENCEIIKHSIHYQHIILFLNIFSFYLEVFDVTVQNNRVNFIPLVQIIQLLKPIFMLSVDVNVLERIEEGLRNKWYSIVFLEAL